MTARVMSIAAVATVSVSLLAGPLDVAAIGSAGLPRLFSNSVLHGETVSNVFSVRPRSIVVDSADGGELAIHWTQWTDTSASGHGTAHPDHGTYPIAVRVEDVIDGKFTRLTIMAKIGGKAYPPDRMVLADDGTQLLLWADLDWVHNPESGFSPWPN
jgi:hypothetical protein